MDNTKLSEEKVTRIKEKLNKKAVKPKKKSYKLLLVIWLIAGVLAIMSYGLMAVNNFFSKKELVSHKFITLKIQLPITIEDRKPIEIISPLSKEIIEELPSNLNPLEEKILKTFGIDDFKIALAVAKCESGMREEAFNINTNGTIDIGVYQINSVHFKREGCSLKEVVTIDGNLACAKTLRDEQGWDIWVASTTQCFREAL